MRLTSFSFEAAASFTFQASAALCFWFFSNIPRTKATRGLKGYADVIAKTMIRNLHFGFVRKDTRDATVSVVYRTTDSRE